MKKCHICRKPFEGGQYVFLFEHKDICSDCFSEQVNCDAEKAEEYAAETGVEMLLYRGTQFR